MPITLTSVGGSSSDLAAFPEWRKGSRSRASQRQGRRPSCNRPELLFERCVSLWAAAGLMHFFTSPQQLICIGCRLLWLGPQLVPDFASNRILSSLRRYCRRNSIFQATREHGWCICLPVLHHQFLPELRPQHYYLHCFPTRYRATAHGISAASGKLGAIIAQIMAFELKDRGGTNQWLGHVLEIFALFMFTAILSTLVVPETKQKSLEELSGEGQNDFIKTASV